MRMSLGRSVKHPVVLTCAQQRALRAQGDTARALWNLIHEYYTFHARSKRWPTWAEVDQAIRQGRKDVDWLAVLPAQASQQVLRAYIQAWKNYWGGTHGRPDFKPRRGYTRAVDVPQFRDLNWTRMSTRWVQVNVPKIGKVKVRVHRDLPDVPKGARLKEVTPGRWELIVRGFTTFEVPDLPADPSVLGVDRGVAVTVATSSPDRALRFIDQAPTLSDGEAKRLYRLECKAARQRAHRPKNTRPSNREQVTYDKIAHLRARAARRRDNFAHQVSHTLATTANVVVFEDLHVKNMTRTAKGTTENPGTRVAQKAGLNRVILDQGWGDILTKTTYKTAQRGGRVVTVPAPHTSTTCHACQVSRPDNRDNQALFTCKNPACGWTGNADHNAAINIERSGRNTLGQQPLPVQQQPSGPERSSQDVEPNATRQAMKRHNRRSTSSVAAA